MGLPMGQKLKPLDGFTPFSSMELFKPAVVQHYGSDFDLGFPKSDDKNAVSRV